MPPKSKYDKEKEDDDDDDDDDTGEGLPDLPDFDEEEGRKYWLDVVTIENDIERNKILLQIYDAPMLENISKHMSYGQLRSLEDAAKAETKHGHRAPWKVLTIVGIPFPYFSIGLWLTFFFSIPFIKITLAALFYITVLTQLSIIVASYVFSQFVNNIKGACHQCKKTIPKNRKIMVYRYNIITRSSKEVKHSDSGYCDSCAWEVHRVDMISTIVNKRWDSITQKENKMRGIIFKVWKDPFVGGNNNTYTLADRKYPKDQTTEDDYLAKAESRAMETWNMIRVARGKKRMMFR